MNYSLIIADDEIMMRNGLTQIIDWSKSGFKVDAIFTDGSEVIDYLKDNVPDVVLADIKMVRVSGLEVAQFIAQNRLPTKIVLLSGYKDFEYARQALQYNVEHYLLKPVSISQLREVFSSIKDQLDQQNTVDDALQYRMDRYNRLIHYQRRQFFLEASMGILSENTNLQNRLEVLELTEEQAKNPLILCDFSLEEDATYQQFIAEFGLQEMEEQMVHLLESFDHRLEFYLLDSRPAKLSGLFRQRSENQQPALYQNENEVAESLQKLIHMMMGLTVSSVKVQYMDGISALVSQRKADYTSEQLTDLPYNQDFFHLIQEQKKLILTYIQESMPREAKQVFQSFLDQCLTLGIHAAQTHISHLFTVVAEKISQTDAQYLSQLLAKLSILQASTLYTRQTLYQWGASRIDLLVSLLMDRESHISKESCITTIQKYIHENYNKDISLSDAAEKVYLNPIYVSRLFKERTGETFTEYLSKVRISAAVDYLNHSDRYVYEISELVGYHDIKYFYKVFRKLKGFSPSEYRQRKKNEERTDTPHAAV